VSTVCFLTLTLEDRICAQFGNEYRTVRDYYKPRKDLVVIQDVSGFVPDLATTEIDAEGNTV
jgi:hypothetical protein